MATPDDERNPFIEIALSSSGALIPLAFWGAAYLLYMDSHSKGYYSPEIENWILGLSVMGLFPGVPAGVMLGLAIAERGES